MPKDLSQQVHILQQQVCYLKQELDNLCCINKCQLPQQINLCPTMKFINIPLTKTWFPGNEEAILFLETITPGPCGKTTITATITAQTIITTPIDGINIYRLYIDGLQITQSGYDITDYSTNKINLETSVLTWVGSTPNSIRITAQLISTDIYAKSTVASTTPDFKDATGAFLSIVNY